MVRGNEPRFVVASGDGRKRDRTCCLRKRRHGWSIYGAGERGEGCGAEIRTRAHVSEFGVDGDAPKVVLEGEEIESRVVVSNADPRSTFLNLVDPIDLDPNFLSKMRNYRAPGVAAKINLDYRSLTA